MKQLQYVSFSKMGGFKGIQFVKHLIKGNRVIIKDWIICSEESDAYNKPLGKTLSVPVPIQQESLNLEQLW